MALSSWPHRVFSEYARAVGPRKALAEAIDFAREGDTIIVTKLDRLARSIAHLIEIVDSLAAKGVELRILSMNLDTATPTGRLMLNVFGLIAQFKREMMLERQREGVAKAKADGKYKGRKPTARAKADDIRRLAADGLKREEIAERLGVRPPIDRSSMARIGRWRTGGFGRSKCRSRHSLLHSARLYIITFII
jgi:DNA invertase Pin-like site-specific DNA recombinase